MNRAYATLIISLVAIVPSFAAAYSYYFPETYWCGSYDAYAPCDSYSPYDYQYMYGSYDYWADDYWVDHWYDEYWYDSYDGYCCSGYGYYPTYVEDPHQWIYDYWTGDWY